jgi:AsmA-like C-terminal region
VSPGESTSADDVATAMSGNFRLGSGILTLSQLHFAVPGADVQLDGTYTLNHETMDFRGKVMLQAKLSQTTTGVKSFLLKLADPIFSKPGSGAVLPIRITGPAQHPHYGLELKRRGSSSTESR